MVLLGLFDEDTVQIAVLNRGIKQENGEKFIHLCKQKGIYAMIYCINA